MTHDTSSPEHTSCCGHDSSTPTSAEEACTCTCAKCRKPRYWLWILGFALFYVLSVIPAGLLAYTLKNTFDINVFRYGGYHAYLSCVKESLYIDHYR